MAGRRYPNQQLRSVSLETFFRGRLDGLVRMGEVQAELDERFPNLLVPNLQPGEAWALRPSHLRNRESTRSVALAMNQATYVAFDYPGYEAFIAEAIEILPQALRTMRIDELTRAVYRYDNAIDMPRDDEGYLPLDQLLDLSLPGWMGAGPLRQLSMEWSRKWEGGTISGRVFHEDHEAHSTLRILIAASVEPAGAVSNLESYASAAHEQAVGVFEAMITEPFREFLAMSTQEASDG